MGYFLERGLEQFVKVEAFAGDRRVASLFVGQSAWGAPIRFHAARLEVALDDVSRRAQATKDPHDRAGRRCWWGARVERSSLEPIAATRVARLACACVGAYWGLLLVVVGGGGREGGVNGGGLGVGCFGGGAGAVVVVAAVVVYGMYE